MIGFDGHWLSGTLALPIWIVAVAAAVFLFVLILAVSRPGIGRRALVLGRQALAVAVLLMLGGLLDHLVLRPGLRDDAAGVRADAQPTAERQALEARARDLASRGLAPGSGLACLAGGAGDALETACEKVIFANPETAAAALAYTAQRVALLADAVDYARRSDPAFALRLDPWRRSLEADRYGLVAQVLSRDGCSADKCDALALFRDPQAVKANLRAHTFDGLVAQYSESWKARPAEPATAAASAPTGALPVVRNIDFPSAASFPAVSIMSPEPAGPAPAPSPSAAAPGPKRPAAATAEAPPRHPAPKRVATPATRPTTDPRASLTGGGNAPTPAAEAGEAQAQ